MKTDRNEIRKRLLEVSRKSFLENGYQKTTMRDIAKEANVTLSNIYNYFKNKDEILEVILEPVLSDMEQLLNRYNDPYYATNNWIEVKDVSEMDEFQKYVRFIITYQKEFDLILHKCSGSKYENIKDYFIDRYTKVSKDYLQLMKKKYPQVNKNISDFFMHTMASWWIQIVSEIVSHNLNEKEILDFLKEYMTFGTGGWKRLMNL